MLILRTNRVLTCTRAMGSEFNCNLDITRSIQRITNYLLVYVTVLEKRVLVAQKLKWIYKRLKCQL